MNKPVSSSFFAWTSSMMICAILTLAMMRPAVAAPPDVVASIKPVQALVKMVMGDLATPRLMMPANTSPHLFTLKPSQAKMLERADVVFWIGPGLESNLKGPLKNLAAQALVIELLDAAGLDLIKLHDDDEHDDHEAGHDEHEAVHDDHDEHDEHDEHKAEHDEHEAGHDEHGHDHGSVDPHIWLSPSNGLVLIDAIAATLSNVDPDNASAYAKNAKKAKQRIKILIRKTKAYSKQMHDTPYLVQHDGFSYLAREFGLNEVGHIQTMPGREPGAKHVAELLAQIKSKQVKCLFHETQFSPKLARRLEKEAHIGLREIDPMGINVMMTETAYVRIIQGVIVSMESCLYAQQ